MVEQVPIFPNRINNTTFLFETVRWTLYTFISTRTYILYLFDSERTITGAIDSIPFNRKEFDSIDPDLYEYLVRATYLDTEGNLVDLDVQQFSGEVDGLKYCIEACPGLGKVKLILEEYIIISPVRQLIMYFPEVENIHRSQLHNHLLEEYINILPKGGPPAESKENLILPKELPGVSTVTLEGFKYSYHINLKDDIIVLLMPSVVYEFDSDDVEKFPEIKSYKEGKLLLELQKILLSFGIDLV